MSIESSSLTTITVDTSEVNIAPVIDVVNNNTHCIDNTVVSSIVEGHKKEYSIIGDNLYASVSAEQSPQWLTTLIDDVVTSNLAAAIAGPFADINSSLNTTTNLVNTLTQSNNAVIDSVNTALAAIDVASNTYVENINFESAVDSIVASHIATLNATYENTLATKTELDIAVATVNDSLASSTVALTSNYTDAIQASAIDITNAYTSLTTALSSSIDALTVTIDGNTASIIEESTIRAEETGNLYGMYNVRIALDANGQEYVTGFGLAADIINGTASSAFTVSADSFIILDPLNPDINASPFTVYTTPQTFNQGQPDEYTLNAGVYIDNAVIGQLTAGQIDTRGLTIRDDYGNIILASGTPLTSSYITPATSWLNSNVSINSDGTLSGAGSGQVTIAGLDDTVIRDGKKITSANATTYISDAAIGTAQVGQLTADNIAAGTITADKIESLSLNNALFAGSVYNLAGITTSVPAGSWLEEGTTILDEFIVDPVVSAPNREFLIDISISFITRLERNFNGTATQRAENYHVTNAIWIDKWNPSTSTWDAVYTPGTGGTYTLIGMLSGTIKTVGFTNHTGSFSFLATAGTYRLRTFTYAEAYNFSVAGPLAWDYLYGGNYGYKYFGYKSFVKIFRG